MMNAQEEARAHRRSKFRDLPRWFWRVIRNPGRVAYALGLGPLIGRNVLILTTRGRKSGRPHATPLQYEEVGGTVYVGSARGERADWFQNILADPEVEVRMKRHRFRGRAETITETSRVADFLELRLERHPKMVGAILRSEGFPSRPSRAQIEEYAAKRAMVAIHPLDPQQAERSEEGRRAPPGDANG